MNQEVLKQPIVILADANDHDGEVSRWRSYAPFMLAIVGSFALLGLRLSFGPDRFISDGAAMILALGSYLIAAVFYLTNLYAPFRFAESFGMWAATLGVFFNFSSWLLR